MFTCYFDEAGGKDFGFTVVAGYVASVEEWEHFEVDWKLSLISYKVPYFHMAKLSQFKPPYAKWERSPNFRARFLLELAQIIQSRVRRGFVCCVNHDFFKQADAQYELRETLGSPYAFAARICVAYANEWRRKTVKHLDLEYFFEDGGPDKGGVIHAMDIPPKLPAPFFRPSRDIQDRKTGLRRGVVQLQAADYLAYEIRKYILDHPKYRSGERQPRGSLGALTGVEVDRRFLRASEIVRLCEAWKLKRRLKT